MSDLYSYLLSFGPAWWGIMTAGAFFGVDELAQRHWLWLKKKLDTIPPRIRHAVEVLALLAAVFFAGFFAWKDEHTARVAAETRNSVAPRSLTSAQSQELAQNLKPLLAEIPSIKVYADGSVPEINHYAYDFVKAFKDAGIEKADGPVMWWTDSADDRGVYVAVADPKNPPSIASRFAQALRASGIPTAITKADENMLTIPGGNGIFVLFVCAP